jgi:CHAD domain-containing protein
MEKKLLTKYVHDNQKIFQQYADKVQKKTSEESIHKLRVSIRRIRSVSKLLGIKLKSKSIKKFGKRLGELRDLDVALKNSEIYELEDSSLKNERKKLAKKIQIDFKKKEIQKMLDEIKALKWKVTSLQLAQAPQVVGLNKELNDWRKRKLSRKNLHAFRIAIKKLRYILEATGKPLGNLKRMQDLLGELHDLQVLTELLGEDKQVNKDFTLKLKEAAEAFPAAIKSSKQLFT